MTTANTISTLFGKMARFSPLKWGRRLNHRFLCPNCLHFGGFDFACGECWAEIPGYADGNNTQRCPRCQQSLLSASGGGARAYCKQCKGNCDYAIYHQRQVHVLATLRSADSASLHRAISGQEYQPQDGRGYVYDDGSRLAYVLNLSDFTDEAHSLPQTHALWEAQAIWLDMSASNPKELALEAGEAADRFIAQARLTEAQRQAMKVCVQQAEADPVVKTVLETRFGKVGYGVRAQDFLCERAQTKAEALGEIGHNSTVPTLIAAFKDSGGNMHEETENALVTIGKPAIPALSAALKDSDRGVRRRAAEALGEIGHVSAVPILIEALKDGSKHVRLRAKASNSGVRQQAAKALGKIGHVSAVPALIEALKDGGEHVRSRAAEALGAIGDDTAVPALIVALKDSDEYVRKRATEALVKIGKPAVPALIAALKNGNKHVAEALGAIGDDAAVPALIVELNWWSGEHVRKSATEALVKIGKPAVPALIAALNDSNSGVRGGAAKALEAIGDTAAVPALYAADSVRHSKYGCEFCSALNRLRLLRAK
jgi:HEAT repeat protein